MWDMRYDANGNMTSLKRNAFSGNTLTIDNLTYHYATNSNRLSHISDAANVSSIYNDLQSQNAGNYSYDASGMMTADASQQKTVSYDAFGMEKSVMVNGVMIASYTYDEGGNRLSKTEYVPNLPHRFSGLLDCGAGLVCSPEKHSQKAIAFVKTLLFCYLCEPER